MAVKSEPEIKVADLVKMLAQGQYDDIAVKLVQMLDQQEKAKRKKRTDWEEFDVDDLERFMVHADKLKDELKEFGPYTHESGIGSDDALIDEAKYLSERLYTILAYLAVKASHEWNEAVEEEKAAEAESAAGGRDGKERKR